MEAFGEAFDVPDSTDWLKTPLAGLVPVEQAFRCHVCKDFFNSPMLTSCNHTFCSICIRRCLALDGKCPLCRAPDQESKLRGNWALREAVDAFVTARDAILQFAKKPPIVAGPGSPKRKADKVDGFEAREETKRPRMSTRASKARAAEAASAMAQEVIDLEDDEDEDHDDPEFQPEPDDGLAACPICWTRMKPWQVDRHIDNSCPGSPQSQKPTTSRSPAKKGFRSAFPGQASQKPPERLPTLAYSMLNDTKLRKKMTELGLSAAGSRQTLEARHKEWITLWNANCDSAHPKGRRELLQDLDVWERTVGTRASTATRAAHVGAQIKDKNFDGAAWAAKHDTSFKDLIANARKTRSQTEKRVEETKPQVETLNQDPAPVVTVPQVQPLIPVLGMEAPEIARIQRASQHEGLELRGGCETVQVVRTPERGAPWGSGPGYL
ncbi:hypothetical protein OQA88_2206 [Cercophora sp. LCS_1]